MSAITTPKFLTVSIGGSNNEPTRTFEVVWNEPLGRYTAISVTVTRPIAPVTTEDLSGSAVRRSIANGIRPLLLAANPELADQQVFKVWADPSRKARPLAAHKITDPDPEVVERAATLIALERAVGGFPIRTLQRCLKIEYHDAKRLVRRLPKKEVTK